MSPHRAVVPRYLTFLHREELVFAVAAVESSCPCHHLLPYSLGQYARMCADSIDTIDKIRIGQGIADSIRHHEFHCRSRDQAECRVSRKYIRPIV